jgi:NAD+-dependent secondary alcohol dehydrogenase Adh1
MKAARVHEYDAELGGPEFLKVEDVPEPTIGEPDDVIVRIGGAGLCRTDLHIVEGLWEDARLVDMPYVLGHENAGWVEEIGTSVRRFERGDPVVIQPGLSDGLCLSCMRGLDNHCENLVFLGIQQDGGFAEFLKVKERNLVRLPEGLEPRDAAPYADAGLTAFHAVKKAAKVLEPDGTAVLIGVGGIGHVAVQALRALSSARIIVLEKSDLALELARELGADTMIKSSDDSVEEVLELTQGTGAEAVLDFVGESDVPAQALAMTRMGGYYFVIGYGGTIEVPTMEMIATEKNIIGNLGGTTSELRELVALAGEGKVHLTTRHYALDEINEAISDLHEGRIKGRGVLVP